MESTKPNIFKTDLRNIFVFAAMVLVLLTSCSVKNGLAFLAGIPSNSEQGLPKKSNYFSDDKSEKCFYSESPDTFISQEVSSNSNDLLPALLLAAVILLLLGYTPFQVQSHPLYGNLKITGPLPIFLQYRKLIL